MAENLYLKTCDKYEVEHIFPCDTDDEHGMDEAVGTLVAELYKKSVILEEAKKGLGNE